jgi:hypothetical protein
VRFRPLAAGCLIVAALLGGCGGGGGGGVSPATGNDPFYGVIAPEPLPGASLLDTLGHGGAGTLRVNLAWSSVQAGPSAPFDWSHYDPVIAGAARNGIHVLPTIYSSPLWVEPSPETPPLGAALPRFQSFVRAAVRRYGSDGTFWSDHPDLPTLPITDWELWNEPNSPIFWKPAPDAAQYASLLAAFHSTVRSADPVAQILIGGLFPTPSGGIPMGEFLAQLQRAGADADFDAASLHPYARNPAQALQRISQLRSGLRAAGAGTKPIWVTEVGWASGGAPSSVTVGPTRQAAYVTELFRLASAARQRLGIAGVIWYSLIDTPGPVWVTNCGLFDVNGSPKPSWSAFERVAPPPAAAS